MGQFKRRSFQFPTHPTLQQSLTAQHSAQEQGAAVRAKGFGCSDDRGGSSCKTSAWKKGVLLAEDPTASALSSEEVLLTEDRAWSLGEREQASLWRNKPVQGCAQPRGALRDSF